MLQLDTSTWFITIVSTLFTLLIIMQPKVSSHHYYSTPEPALTKAPKSSTPWETKWMKIYLPLSLPQW